MTYLQLFTNNVRFFYELSKFFLNFCHILNVYRFILKNTVYNMITYLETHKLSKKNSHHKNQKNVNTGKCSLAIHDYTH